MTLIQLLLLIGLHAPTVEGYVTDEETGARLQGARVELGQTAWTLTDSLGRYELHAAEAGTRTLRISRLGYQSQTLDVILPTLGALRLDVALRATPTLMPLVRVFAAQVVAGTRRSDRVGDPGVRRLTAAQLRASPIAAAPDMLGAFEAEHDVSMAPESPVAIHVHGASSDQVRLLIDGVPFYSVAHGSGAFGAVNPDAVDAVALHAGARSTAYGGTLAGTIDAQTLRADSTATSLRGGVSTTALRLTFAGPFLDGRSDLVLSGRVGKPALFAGRPDHTRVSAAFNDWLAKSTSHIGSGTLTLLAAAAADRTAFSTSAEGRNAARAAGRHSFDWSGMTVAAIWSATMRGGTILRTSVWNAGFDADATWLSTGLARMSSTRQSTGLQSTLVRRRAAGELRSGAELLYDRVTYGVAGSTDTAFNAPGFGRATEASVTLFSEYLAHVASRWDFRPGVRALVLSSGSMLVEPRFSASYRLAANVSISGGFARNFQTVQSLRNPESPAGSVFGPDLPVMAHASVPIGRADEGTLGVEARLGWSRLTADAYVRRLTGLVLAQPQVGTPFAIAEPALGRGRAWGVGGALDVDRSRLTARVSAGLSGSHVKLAPSLAPTFSYQPDFATTRTLTAGAAYRVNENASIRSAVFARWGRRTTLYEGALDWGGCDALDGGCELSGSPGRSLGAISGVTLPPYVRWDIGAKRAWTAHLAGRDVRLEANATLRNLLDRRNVFGYSTQSSDIGRRSLLLRPVSLLTAGLDFRF